MKTKPLERVSLYHLQTKYLKEASATKTILVIYDPDLWFYLNPSEAREFLQGELGYEENASKGSPEFIVIDVSSVDSIMSLVDTKNPKSLPIEVNATAEFIKQKRHLLISGCVEIWHHGKKFRTYEPLKHKPKNMKAQECRA